MVNEDFYDRTLFTGAITLASSVVMLLLVVSELRTRLTFSDTRHRCAVCCILLWI
jgi:hypothetical protein